MKILSLIILFLICTIAMAFWKDIKNISAQKNRRKRQEPKPVKEFVKREKGNK